MEKCLTSPAVENLTMNPIKASFSIQLRNIRSILHPLVKKLILGNHWDFMRYHMNIKIMAIPLRKNKVLSMMKLDQMERLKINLTIHLKLRDIKNMINMRSEEHTP